MLKLNVALVSATCPSGPAVIFATGRSGAGVAVRIAAYSEEPLAVVCEAVSFWPFGRRPEKASDNVPSAATIAAPGVVGSV